MSGRAQNILLQPRRSKVAKRELRPEELQEVKDAFKVLESDRGSISCPEIKVAMRALGFPVKKAEVLEILKDYNKEASGTVDLGEFQEIMAYKILHQDPVEENKKVFALFDTGGDGKITAKTLRRLARQIGTTIEDDELLDMIDEFDIDGDGAINQEEFFSILNEVD